jgi:hypothetical protein
MCCSFPSITQIWRGRNIGKSGALAEVEVVVMMAGLIGYDPEHWRYVSFGGTGITLYGIKLGLGKAVPGTMEHGIRENAVVFASVIVVVTISQDV